MNAAILGKNMHGKAPCRRYTAPHERFLHTRRNSQELFQNRFPQAYKFHLQTKYLSIFRDSLGWTCTGKDFPYRSTSAKQGNVVCKIAAGGRIHQVAEKLGTRVRFFIWWKLLIWLRDLRGNFRAVLSIVSQQANKRFYLPCYSVADTKTSPRVDSPNSTCRNTVLPSKAVVQVLRHLGD